MINSVLLIAVLVTDVAKLHYAATVAAICQWRRRSACVKTGDTLCEHCIFDLTFELALITFISTFITALNNHRRTSQGAGGLQPPDSGKTVIFRAKATFFGQNPATKNEKNCIY